MPPRAVVLTFDDGYRDTFEAVLPLLERRCFPATVFVTPGSPGCAFWWDELAVILHRKTTLPSHLVLELGGITRSWSFSSNGKNSRQEMRLRRQALQEIAAELRNQSAENRDESISRIRALCGHSEAGVAAHRSLTIDEMRRLAESPLIEIGAHTMSHPVLARLPDSLQLREIQVSRTTLQAATGQAVTLFSYPHGSFSASTMAAVRDCGFQAACCSTLDIATTQSSHFALPRLWVADQDGARFDTWLRHWLVN